MALLGQFLFLLLGGGVAFSAFAGDESDESSCLAVRRTPAVEPSSRISAGRLAMSAFEATVDSVIEEAFKDVTGFGSNLVPMVHEDPVWQKCAEYDLSSDTARGASMMAGVGRLLGCEEQYKGDDTCKAINASFDALNALQDKFPEGPKFANFFVNNWAGVPTWANWTMGPGGVDQSVMPPSADVVEPNGIMLYALCDILRTVLTQAPNQYGHGSCGWVATIGVLSYAAPAKAIKMAVRLLWTGRVVPQIALPCEPITETQFPGLIPFMDVNMTWQPPFVAEYPYAESAVQTCSGNPADCSISLGNPGSPAGLTGSWSQSLISAYRQSVDVECGDPQSVLPLLYPGVSEADKKHNGDVNGQTIGEAMWTCNAIIDPQNKTCRYLFNPATCGTQDLQACEDLMRRVRVGPQTPDLSNHLNLSFFASLFMQFTDELLQEACNSAVALLLVDAYPFMDRTAQYNYNHVVYLRACDPAADVYTIWTWGRLINVTRADLIGEPLNATEVVDVLNKTILPGALEPLAPGETAASLLDDKSFNPFEIKASAFNNGRVCGAVVTDGVTFAGQAV